MASLINNNPQLIQLDFSVLKNTQKAYEYGRCYSKNGLSFSHVNFGNADKLGTASTLALYVEPHLLASRKFQVTLRAGGGVAYLNKVYNAVSDSNNLFYSKPLSYLLLVNVNVYYALTANVRVNVSAQFSHISNGGARWPNYGMNFPTWGLGIEYAIHPQVLQARTCAPFTNRSVKVITHLFGGRNTARAGDSYPEEKKPVFGINAGVLKPLGRISALGFGGELYYDAICKVKQTRYEKKFNSTIGSVSLQHYFFFGKLLCGQQLAYYITKLNPDTPTNFYQRYFFEYKVKGPLYLGVSLKAHGQISDYMSITTSYIFF
jgi:hypothetical protein